MKVKQLKEAIHHLDDELPIYIVTKAPNTRYQGWDIHVVTRMNPREEKRNPYTYVNFEV